MERTVRVPNSSPIDVPDNVSISTEHISKPEYEHVAASDASVNGSRSSGTVVNPVIDEPANRVAVGAPRAESTIAPPVMIPQKLILPIPAIPILRTLYEIVGNRS
ncbi:hypothetical protein CVT25_000612 [Psilocybe cyanescens]|uniref:Uncharacterized protein n=1 Tax=Psilocybe cyanescens TaxID=93625 RepID=A0A409XUJ3_PSICY|nr:hypothetical protein CVT25_000612 [Psilocybe cyanescens]